MNIDFSFQKAITHFFTPISQCFSVFLMMQSYEITAQHELWLNNSLSLSLKLYIQSIRGVFESRLKHFLTVNFLFLNFTDIKNTFSKVTMGFVKFDGHWSQFSDILKGNSSIFTCFSVEMVHAYQKVWNRSGRLPQLAAMPQMQCLQFNPLRL